MGKNGEGACLHGPNASPGANIQNTLGRWPDGREEKITIEHEGVEVVARQAVSELASNLGRRMQSSPDVEMVTRPLVVWAPVLAFLISMVAPAVFMPVVRDRRSDTDS